MRGPARLRRRDYTPSKFRRGRAPAFSDSREFGYAAPKCAATINTAH